ncbi:hypothetical protein K440DRAFT_101810 [Wilcoxina mikolae CBS 423.85]|nr:hypothetical protein K440DRAFT_101810 [Wilcoxina mikolae CBS 423.85]
MRRSPSDVGTFAANNLECSIITSSSSRAIGLENETPAPVTQVKRPKRPKRPQRPQRPLRPLHPSTPSIPRFLHLHVFLAPQTLRPVALCSDCYSHSSLVSVDPPKTAV